MDQSVILEQQIRGDKRRFKLTPEGVDVYFNQRGNEQRYNLSFDQIKTNEHVYIKKADPVVWFFVFSALLNAILLNIVITDSYDLSFENGKWVFIGCFCIFLLILLLLKDHFQKVNMLSLDADKYLSFIYNSKYKDAVDAFISDIKSHQMSYYRTKFYLIDPIIPYEIQKSRLLWLYESNHISETEYETIHTELENQKIIKGEP